MVNYFFAQISNSSLGTKLTRAMDITDIQSDILLLSLIATEAASTTFFAAFLFYSKMWDELRRLDSPPEWFTFKLLVFCRVLRIRRDDEILHKRISAEIFMAAVSFAYTLIGAVNFAAGVISLNFVANVRDETCTIAEEIGNQCKSPHCHFGCGNIDFTSCGSIMCNASRCASNLVAFLAAAGDSTSINAAKNFENLQEQFAVVQGAASIFGSISSVLLLAVPAMNAAYRADASAWSATFYLSLICAPAYFAMALLVFIYSWPLREPCTHTPTYFDSSCSVGLSARYWGNLCRMGYMSMDMCTASMVISVSALSAEGLLATLTSVVVYRLHTTYLLNVAYRRSVEEAEKSLAAQGRAGAVHPDSGAQRRMRLVTDDDYMRLPGLLQLYRGHSGAVLCAIIAPLPRVAADGTDGPGDSGGGDSEETERLITGSMDGTIRVWDVVEGTCLCTWKAGRPVQALCVHRTKMATRIQHRQPPAALVGKRAQWPESDGRLFADVRPSDVVLWIRVFWARPDTFKPRRPAGGGGGSVTPGDAMERAETGAGREGRREGDRAWNAELVGGCFFALREAMQVTTR